MEGNRKIKSSEYSDTSVVISKHNFESLIKESQVVCFGDVIYRDLFEYAKEEKAISLVLVREAFAITNNNSASSLSKVPYRFAFCILDGKIKCRVHATKF